MNGIFDSKSIYLGSMDGISDSKTIYRYLSGMDGISDIKELCLFMTENFSIVAGIKLYPSSLKFGLSINIFR